MNECDVTHNRAREMRHRRVKERPLGALGRMGKGMRIGTTHEKFTSPQWPLSLGDALNTGAYSPQPSCAKRPRRPAQRVAGSLLPGAHKDFARFSHYSTAQHKSGARIPSSATDADKAAYQATVAKFFYEHGEKKKETSFKLTRRRRHQRARSRNTIHHGCSKQSSEWPQCNERANIRAVIFSNATAHHSTSGPKRPPGRQQAGAANKTLRLPK